jgi:hypothetical protein
MITLKVRKKLSGLYCFDISTIFCNFEHMILDKAKLHFIFRYLAKC